MFIFDALLGRSNFILEIDLEIDQPLLISKILRFYYLLGFEEIAQNL